jgi:hypothetical protein
MPRRCTICAHGNLPEINRALIGRQAFRAIARQYGVSKDALLRHHDDHLPASLVKAKEASEAAQADALLAQVVDLRDKALGVLTKAENSDDLRAAVAAIREARGCVELLGKLAGQLQDAPTVNIVLSPEWMAIQTNILAALGPHPEARLAVVHALEGVEHVGNA